MTCPRCQGFMIGEGYEGTSVDTGESGFAAWRCVNCGDVVDSVILAHRRQASGVRHEALPTVRQGAIALAA